MAFHRACSSAVLEPSCPGCSSTLSPFPERSSTPCKRDEMDAQAAALRSRLALVSCWACAVSTSSADCFSCMSSRFSTTLSKRDEMDAQAAALRSRLALVSCWACAVSISSADCFSCISSRSPTSFSRVAKEGCNESTVACSDISFVDNAISALPNACCSTSTWPCTASNPLSVTLSRRWSSLSTRDSVDRSWMDALGAWVVGASQLQCPMRVERLCNSASINCCSKEASTIATSCCVCNSCRKLLNPCSSAFPTVFWSCIA